jgi:hypothetical protein
MSEAVLMEPLLDFGTTYWGSALMREEHEGLWAKDFEPTGRFGIGFFSVFMWDRRVRITTRRYRKDAQEDTRILEFWAGLDTRPLVRPANMDEQLQEAGTQVRVWLNKEPKSQGGLLWPPLVDGPVELGALCAWLAPSLDVDVYVKTPEAEVLRVVAASDWLTITEADLLARLSLVSPTQPAISMAEFISVIKLGDRVLGRASILHADVESFPRNPAATGAITVGGLRAKNLSSIVGILIGYPKRAARDEAELLCPAALASWASDQAEIVSSIVPGPEAQMYFAASVLALGGRPGKLPVVRHGRIFFDQETLESWSNAPDDVMFYSNDFIASRAMSQDVMLLPNVLVGCASLATFELGGLRVMPALVLKALARIWQCSTGEIEIERLSSARVGVDRDGANVAVANVLNFHKPGWRRTPT